jgi:hypothetical protein
MNEVAERPAAVGDRYAGCDTLQPRDVPVPQLVVCLGAILVVPTEETAKPAINPHIPELCTQLDRSPHVMRRDGSADLTSFN